MSVDRGSQADAIHRPVATAYEIEKSRLA